MSSSSDDDIQYIPTPGPSRKATTTASYSKSTFPGVGSSMGNMNAAASKPKIKPNSVSPPLPSSRLSSLANGINSRSNAMQNGNGVSSSRVKPSTSPAPFPMDLDEFVSSRIAAGAGAGVGSSSRNIATTNGKGKAKATTTTRGGSEVKPILSRGRTERSPYFSGSNEEDEYKRGEGDEDEDIMILDEPIPLPGPGAGRKPVVARNAIAGPSRSRVGGVMDSGVVNGREHEGGMGLRRELEGKMRLLEEEILQVREQIKPLQALEQTLQQDKDLLLAQLNSLSSLPSINAKSRANNTKSNSNSKAINYMATTAGDEGEEPPFEWTGMLKSKMRKVWGIREFRLCQEGVCNANMDGRDILVVMPTGGGKSLTYQLPALLSKGTTIVISPLLSLISDQVFHLREAGIECVMLTGSTSKEDQNEAFQRMSNGPSGGRKEIKLCYVTPEKVAKSKRFTSVLEKMYSAGNLARIVIDEAHCASQLGHDFRPDYRKLGVLKTLFPDVPILAVTATLSKKVLPDLLKILKLPALTDGTAANATGTCYFASPLYRANLHYTVVPKPSNAKQAIEKMAEYIVSKHLGKCGIVYCLSKKDSETVAEGLKEASNGAIKTGVYHADVGDHEKENIHRRWREGKVHCVVATIAFGLGIDCPMTQYVLHHSLSKSIDGYYQETGRAGRDGRDADCVLFYRSQDATRLTGLTLGEPGGQEKIYEMLRYAQDLTTCRKVLFAEYFSTSASMPSQAWDDVDTAEGGPSNGRVAVCGHCDNCIRDPATIASVDVTRETWFLVKLIDDIRQQGGRVTVSGLADLARGLGGGSFPVVTTTRKGKSKVSSDKGSVDLAELGGKLTISKDQAESLLIDLILKGYLAEDYRSNAYAVNVYVQSGRNGIRLSRLSKEQADSGRFPVKVESTYFSKPVKVKATKAKDPAAPKRKRVPKEKNMSKAQKSKNFLVSDDDDEEEEDLGLDDIDDDDEEEDMEEVPPAKKKRKSAEKASVSAPVEVNMDAEQEEEDEFEEEFRLLREQEAAGDFDDSLDEEGGWTGAVPYGGSRRGVV